MNKQMPTQEQNEEFWKRYGFKRGATLAVKAHPDRRKGEHKAGYTGWFEPNGEFYSINDLPVPDLNNLFKWAIPKAHAELGDKEFFKLLVRWCMKVIEEGDDALALYWLLGQVKETQK